MKSAIVFNGRFAGLAALMLPVLLFVFLTGSVSANNITVSNVTYLSASDEVQFDLTWENSWRNTASAGSTQNFDGAWVFVKYRHACADDSLNASEYRHMWLNTTASTHTVPVGDSLRVGTTTISATARGMGVFIYRATDGSGTFTASGVKLKWDKAAQGAVGTDWDIRVFAIEMVYIPAAAFYLGDGGGSNYQFYAYPTTTSPYKVTAENAALNVGTTSGYLYCGTVTIGSGNLPAGYPKGYGPFWIMKYEVTQLQYVDFLNSLNRSQQASYVVTSGLGAGNMTATNVYVMSNSSTIQYRNGIRCPSTFHSTKPITFFCDQNGNGIGNEADDGMMIACNYIGYSSYYLLRWLDWAALRPMSELEFEKVCRGSDAVYGGLISNETPWSLTGSIAGNYTYVTNMTNMGRANETPSTTGIGLVHAGNTTVNGPRRVGSTFTLSTDRIYAGAAYYGAADMGGNVMEYVNKAYAANAFVRTDLGDGTMATSYPSNWTSYPAFRGGDYAESITYCAISDRYYVQNYTSATNYYSGGRGAR